LKIFLQTTAGSKEPTDLSSSFKAESVSRDQEQRSPHEAPVLISLKVFAMLWDEPAGQSGSMKQVPAHLSVVFSEQAYVEVRRFVVVRNKGSFSQCV
jgi:hypothetical protein